MKKILSLLLITGFLFSVTACASRKMRPSQLEVCLASPSEVKQISATATSAQDIIIQAKSGNVGVVKVGDSGVTTATGLQLNAGISLSLSGLSSAVPGTIFNMQDWYFTGLNAADCVTIFSVNSSN